MSKRSRKRSSRLEKDQSGCIWGLISILHFHDGGFTRKFLLDRRHKSKRNMGVGYVRNELESLTNLNDDFRRTLDHQVNLTTTADSGKPRVKKVMEKEMTSEQTAKQKINSDEVHEKRSQNGHTTKNRKSINKTSRKRSEVTINDWGASGHSHCQNSQKGYPNTHDLESIVEELCSHIRQNRCGKHGPNREIHMQLEEENCGFGAKLCEAIRMYSENFAEDGKLHSDQLVDALQIIGFDKDLYLKLIKDPNSLLVKSLKILEGTEIEKVEKSKSLAVSSSEQEAVTYKQTEEVVNHRQHNFFRRKVKSQEKISLEEIGSPWTSNRIVILKPGITCSHNSVSCFGISQQSKESSEKDVSSFFLTKIKRKWKHAMGKEHHGTSTDVTLNKVLDEHVHSRGNQGVATENSGRNLPSKDHFYIERHVKPSIGIERGDKTSKPVNHVINAEHESSGQPQQIVSNIYIEAKKHLSEMLNNEDEWQHPSSRQVEVSLGEILSFPEFICSPISSPGREWQHSSVTAQMRLSDSDKLARECENTLNSKQDKVSHLDPSSRSLNTTSHISDQDPQVEVKASNSDPNISNDTFSDNMEERLFFCVTDQMCSEADVEIEEVKNTPFTENSNVSDSPLGISSPPMSGHVQDSHTPEITDNDGCRAYFKQNSCEEQHSLITSPSCSSITRQVEDLRSANVIIEQPSPVSVLELVLTEDEISPTRTIYRSDGLKVQPLQINFEEPDCSATYLDIHIVNCIENKESLFMYVKAVLQASDSSWHELYMKSLSLHQLLDPLLFDDIQFFPNQLCHEHKLLFDCINEVLVENCEYYFGSLPLLSFVKPSFRPISNTNKIQKVWEGVYWHLRPHPQPHTLDRIVRKDMEKDTMWMDLRRDTEILGAKKGDTILEEIIEDTILSLVNEIT